MCVLGWVPSSPSNGGFRGGYLPRGSLKKIFRLLKKTQNLDTEKKLGRERGGGGWVESGSITHLTTYPETHRQTPIERQWISVAGQSQEG